MTSASYTYAIARRFDPARATNLRGVDGAAVYLIRHRDLVAVVSPLRSADAHEAALRARLETLPELEAIARSHHAVVEAIAACTATLPLRLATVHRCDDRVVEVLDQEYRGFCATLDRLAGRVELGVKVFLDSSAKLDSPAEVTLAAGSASPGRSYLHHRRQERDQRAQARRAAVTAADQIDTALTEFAIDRRHHRTQSTPLSSATGENILNAAYLVEAGRIDVFARAARRLRSENPQVGVEVTGPWAPYSFAVPGELVGAIAGNPKEPR
jgi:hypothetical protein